MNRFPVIPYLAVIVIGLLTVQAQDDGGDDDFVARPGQITPFSEATAPENYDFLMRVPAGTNIRVRVRPTAAVEEAMQSGNPDAVIDRVPETQRIERQVRSNIVRERIRGANGEEDEKFYLLDWCAYDHPQRGINIRRTTLEGGHEPVNHYHFPELFWAWPDTRKADPEVPEGEVTVHLYEKGARKLEVDGETGLPIRFVDRTREYRYSYSKSGDPVRMPQKLAEAVKRTLKKTGAMP